MSQVLWTLRMVTDPAAPRKRPIRRVGSKPVSDFDYGKLRVLLGEANLLSHLLEGAGDGPEDSIEGRISLDHFGVEASSLKQFRFSPAPGAIRLLRRDRRQPQSCIRFGLHKQWMIG